MSKTGWGLGLTGAVAVGAIALVDEALGRSDLGRAICGWREAYSAGRRSGGSDRPIAVNNRLSILDAHSRGRDSRRRGVQQGGDVHAAEYLALQAMNARRIERKHTTTRRGEDKCVKQSSPLYTLQSLSP